jgi:hypothetical protein
MQWINFFLTTLDLILKLIYELDINAGYIIAAAAAADCCGWYMYCGC